jgi:hypothetical protein
MNTATNPLQRPTYDGADLKRQPARIGSMRAYELSSVENGVEVPRKLPMLIGGRTEAVGVHGGRV